MKFVQNTTVVRAHFPKLLQAIGITVIQGVYRFVKI